MTLSFHHNPLQPSPLARTAADLNVTPHRPRHRVLHPALRPRPAHPRQHPHLRRPPLPLRPPRRLPLQRISPVREAHLLISFLFYFYLRYLSRVPFLFVLFTMRSFSLGVLRRPAGVPRFTCYIFVLYVYRCSHIFIGGVIPPQNFRAVAIDTSGRDLRENIN